MATEKIKNLAASIRQKLLNVAKKRGDDFDLVLARYALERLPPALDVAFAADTAKQAQWAAFLRRNRLDERKYNLAECQAVIAKLVLPALKLARGK